MPRHEAFDVTRAEIGIGYVLKPRKSLAFYGRVFKCRQMKEKMSITTTKHVRNRGEIETDWK